MFVISGRFYTEGITLLMLYTVEHSYQSCDAEWYLFRQVAVKRSPTFNLFVCVCVLTLLGYFD